MTLVFNAIQGESPDGDRSMGLLGAGTVGGGKERTLFLPPAPASMLPHGGGSNNISGCDTGLNS